MTVETADAVTGTLAPVKGHEEGAKALTTQGLETDLRKLLSGEAIGENTPKTGEELQPGATEAGADGVAAEAEHEEGTEAAQQQQAQWPDAAQRRVDKLTEQRGKWRGQAESLEEEKATLEKTVAELQAQVKEAGTGGAVTTPGNPLGFLVTPKALQEFESNVKANLRGVEDYLDESLNEEGLAAFKNWAKANNAFNEETGEFNAVELKRLRRLAQDALSEHVPRRREFLQREAAESQTAEEQFPWLKDPKSEDYKSFREVVNTLPEIKRLPHWKGIAAIFVTGMRAMAGKSKSNGNGKPQTRLPGAGTAVPQRPNTEGNGVAALREKAMKSQNQKDWEALTRAQLESPDA